MSRYTDSFRNPQGAGDARPTALQIVKDEGLDGKLSDKVVLVTGASAGIGLETVKAFHATGAHVFVAVRNVSKAKSALSEISDSPQISFLECDTSSQSSVRSCAKEFLSQSKKLNILVANAGIMMTPTREVTEDGFEGQLAVNYLGHFLLFYLLRDALLAGSTSEFQSRVINVSSLGHHASEIIFDDFQLSQPDAYTPTKAYGQSKLAQIYMTNYIERVYGPKGIHGLSVMPGGIATNLQKHMPKSQTDAFKTDPNVAKLMKTPEQGAATTLYAALAKEWEGKGGKYLENCHVAFLAGEDDYVGAWGYKDYAYDAEKEDRLWKLTLKTLELQS